MSKAMCLCLCNKGSIVWCLPWQAFHTAIKELMAEHDLVSDKGDLHGDVLYLR
jgi:hypothetical protein